MPKIIENVREQLLTEARRQVSERGYSETTIRSVSRSCGLAVGTVYNYFKSKDMLIATFVLEDWMKCLEKMKNLPRGDIYTYLEGVYNTLLGFAKNNEKLFSSEIAAKQISSGSLERHRMLRRQIADICLAVCPEVEGREFCAEFCAESLIAWSSEGKEAERVIPLLIRVIEN